MKEMENLKGSDVFTGEKFSWKITEVRGKLITHLNATKNQKKRARMMFVQLLIEGRNERTTAGEVYKIEQV